MCHFTRLRTVALAVLFLSAAFSLRAQEEQGSHYVIIEQTENADGSRTVVKQRVTEDERLVTIIRSLKDTDGRSVDIQIINEEGANINLEESLKEETLLLIRRAHDEEGEVAKKLEEIRIVTTDKERGSKAMERWFMEGRRGSDHDRPYVGIYVDEDVDAEGVAISSTINGGGAEAAGLRSGDVITVINGQTIGDRHDMRDALAEYEPGETISVSYVRAGESSTTDLTLTARNAWSNRSWERDPCKVFIGVYVGGRGAEGYGVNVSGIIDDTPAEIAGIQSGDLILSFDGVTVNSHSELLAERNKHQPGDWFTITYLRDGVPTDVRAQFRSCEEEPQAEEVVIEEPAGEEIIEVPAVPEPQIDNTLTLERLQVFPNPTYGDLRVQFEAEAVPTIIRVIDTSGRTILEDVQNRFDGYYNQPLDLSGQNSGQYFLQIIQGEKVFTEKIVKVIRA